MPTLNSDQRGQISTDVEALQEKEAFSKGPKVKLVEKTHKHRESVYNGIIEKWKPSNPDIGDLRTLQFCIPAKQYGMDVALINWKDIHQQEFGVVFACWGLHWNILGSLSWHLWTERRLKNHSLRPP